MTDPIVTDTDPMHLDGPLSWCAYLDHEAAGLPLPPKSADMAADFQIGLATWTRPSSGLAEPRTLAADGASAWGWACSAAYAPALLRTVAHTRRPAPVREIARYTTAKTFHTGAGPHEARNVPHASVWAPQVTWWCLGDPDLVRGLLARLRGLGRLTRHGHGTVAEVDVAVDEAARTRWAWRQWPHPGGTVGGYRAPYHHAARRMPVSPLGEPPWA